MGAKAAARGFAARLVLAALAVLLTGTVHARMDTSADVAGDEGLLPSPQHARLASLGFHAVVADYYWLQALNLVGGSGGRTADHAPRIASLVELVTGLDPHVDHPYRFAALWLTDSPESVRRANRMLEDGVEYHPNEWRNLWYLGFNYFFFLEENLAAADALERAAAMEGSPPIFGPLAARLRASVGGLDLAAQMLADRVRATQDEFARAELLKALDEVETERRARFLDDARYEFWKRNRRDIDEVGELLAGEDPVLRELPAAHPIFPGFEWRIDEENGEIVSSFYRSRYELHIHPKDEERREKWRVQF